MTGGYVSEVFVSFQGEGAHAGRRHLFIRLAGCNLRCRYCDTPDSLDRVPRARVRQAAGSVVSIDNPVSVSELLAHTGRLARAEGPIDGVALTGGEPLLQAGFLAELLAGDALPHPRLLETNGMLPERLPGVLPLIDLVSMDIKLPSNTGESEFWDAHRQFLRLARGRAYVKILLDARTAMAEVERAAELVRATAPETPVFLQPIADPRGQFDLESGQLAAFFAAVRRALRDVRVLPQLHKVLGIP